MTNRRVEITAFGGPDVLRLVEDSVLPAPGPGEVRVRVLAAGAAFTDVMIRRSKYPDVKAKPPLTLGLTWLAASMPVVRGRVGLRSATGSRI